MHNPGYTEGTDWQQSGNHVDWLGSGPEPAIGTTYTVRWTYTSQMARGSDYVDGGWFGESDHPAAAEYFYLVTALDASGETAYDVDKVVTRDTRPGDINRLAWRLVSGATGYHVYRAAANAGPADFKLLEELAAAATSYVDDGVAEAVDQHPPDENASGLAMSEVRIAAGERSLVNFGRGTVGNAPVDGSNLSIDYDYFLGRRDVIYATTDEIKRLEGAPADRPKLPVVPEGALALAGIDCPPDSVDMRINKFGLTRVTMDQVHQIIRDVEDLKYNDAQLQMAGELQNRDAQTKKGIYSDDFSSDAQSDVSHDEWSARVDAARRFVGPGRDASATVLEVDRAASRALFGESLVLLPGAETVLVEQADWSEDKNVNPYAVFEGITVRCDGRTVATDVAADAVGRASASFLVPAGARSGSRIVEMSDGERSAQATLQVHDPLVITRIQRVVVARQAPPWASSSPARTPPSRSPFRSAASPPACPTRSCWPRRSSRPTRSNSARKPASPSTIPSTPRRTRATRSCS